MIIGKIIALVLVLVYVAWLVTGGSQSTYSSFKKHSAETVVQQQPEHEVEKVYFSQKAMAKAIEVAGEDNGWIITKYKKNKLIAEKTSEGDTVAVTITFEESAFSLEPDNQDLRDSINMVLH